MRAAYERINNPPDLSWRRLIRQAPAYLFDWHFHPEVELTLITKGHGTRFVGDSIEDYEIGDLVLLGSELPHAYVSNPGTQEQEAIVVQFRHDFLGAGFFDRPEFSPVRAMLDRAKQGLFFPGSISAEALTGLEDPIAARQTLSVLDALVSLSDRHDARPLASQHHNPTLDLAARDRINSILEFLHAGYAGPFRLGDVAEVAHMAPAAVSRFFRRMTGMTMTAYINIVRVNAACRLLVDTDLRITDIAMECGFQNLSHFNRRFLLLKGRPPRDYRARYRRQLGRS
jgi:AraC-like DNA-binding protein